MTVISRRILGCLREGSSAGKKASAKSEEKVSTPAQRRQVSPGEQNNDALGSAVHCLLVEHNLDASAIESTNVDGHLTREDAEKHLVGAPTEESTPTTPALAVRLALAARSRERVLMTCLCKHMAERLLEAKNSTAMLTTFNEINMKPIIDLCKQYGEAFEKHHGIRLGLISFCIKAVVEALKRYPEVNASIDDDNVIYHSYSDVSMAVSTPHGLVAPALHDVGTLGMADIGEGIGGLAVKGRDSELAVEDLVGGNFTITNSGVFGSLMSTPIISPPQSAVLGMHTVKDRPVAVSGQVKILPMMYLAPSYGHRLIGDRESMGFLAIIRELLGDPTRLLLDV